MIFHVQRPRKGYFNACAIDDICKVLSFVPPDDLDGIELIILRQPTRKQEKLNPVWGRLDYYAHTGQYSGTAIFLEAQKVAPLRWSLSLTPDDTAELDRLRADGHRVTKEKRGHLIERSPESIRSTQLFRTLLHELGHYVDWMANKIELALETDDEAEEAWIDQTYDTKPTATKEDFAHRYAAEMAERVPRFPPSMDYDSLRADGLDPEWFRRR